MDATPSQPSSAADPAVPAAANAGRPGDDDPPLAALPNGTTADAGLEHSNVTPLAEESQRSWDTYGDDSQRGIYGVSCQC